MIKVPINFVWFLWKFLFFVKKFRTNDVRLNHTSNKMAEFYFNTIPWRQPSLFLIRLFQHTHIECLTQDTNTDTEFFGVAYLAWLCNGAAAHMYWCKIQPKWKRDERWCARNSDASDTMNTAHFTLCGRIYTMASSKTRFNGYWILNCFLIYAIFSAKNIFIIFVILLE